MKTSLVGAGASAGLWPLWNEFLQGFIVHSLKFGKITQAEAAFFQLRDEGLLEVIEQEGGKTYWGKKSIDRTIRISRLLMDENKLDKNGLLIK